MHYNPKGFITVSSVKDGKFIYAVNTDLGIDNNPIFGSGVYEIEDGELFFKITDNQISLTGTQYQQVYDLLKQRLENAK